MKGGHLEYLFHELGNTQIGGDAHKEEDAEHRSEGGVAEAVQTLHA